MRGALANGLEVKAARQARALTQDQLAERAGVDVKTVRKAEQGKRLDLGTLTKLGFALDRSLSSLIQPGHSPREWEIRRRDAVIRWHSAFDDHDLQELLAVYDDNAVVHLPGAPQIPFGGTFRGKSEICRAVEATWRTCRTEPARQEDFSLLVSDGAVVLQGQKGVYLPSGELALLWWVQIFSFEGDLVVDHRIGYDTLNFAQLFQFPAAGGPSATER